MDEEHGGLNWTKAKRSEWSWDVKTVSCETYLCFSFIFSPFCFPLLSASRRLLLFFPPSICSCPLWFANMLLSLFLTKTAFIWYIITIIPHLLTLNIVCRHLLESPTRQVCFNFPPFSSLTLISFPSFSLKLIPDAPPLSHSPLISRLFCFLWPKWAAEPERASSTHSSSVNPIQASASGLLDCGLVPDLRGTEPARVFEREFVWAEIN